MYNTSIYFKQNVLTLRYFFSAVGFPDGVETYGVVAGLWMSMFALGNCVGPSVAGLLVDAFDYKTGTLFVMGLQLIVVRCIIQFSI
jgi:MFS family permease